MIRRLHLPAATRSKASAIFMWCRPSMKLGHTSFTKFMNFFCANVFFFSSCRCSSSCRSLSCSGTESRGRIEGISANDTSSIGIDVSVEGVEGVEGVDKLKT